MSTYVYDPLLDEVIPAGASPGGSNTNVQFNDSGVFGGSNNLTWDKTNNKLVLRRSVLYGTAGNQLEWYDSSGAQGGRIDEYGYMEIMQGNPTFSAKGAGIQSFKMYNTSTGQDWRFENGRSYTDTFNLTNWGLGGAIALLIDPDTNYWSIGRGSTAPTANLHIGSSLKAGVGHFIDNGAGHLTGYGTNFSILSPGDVFHSDYTGYEATVVTVNSDTDIILDAAVGPNYYYYYNTWEYRQPCLKVDNASSFYANSTWYVSNGHGMFLDDGAGRTGGMFLGGGGDFVFGPTSDHTLNLVTKNGGAGSIQIGNSVDPHIRMYQNLSGGINAFDINVSNGNISQYGLAIKYNNINTVSNGIPSELATIDSTGLTGNVGASTLYAVPSSGAGMYRISAYLVTTTAASVSSTMPNAQVVYTDKDSNTSVTLDVSPILGAAGLGQSGLLTANTVGTIFSGVAVIYVKASTTIQYKTVNYASTAAGMAYALHIKLEAL